MTRQPSLFLYEELLLLALRDKEGTVLPMVQYQYALAGALLAELLLSGAIETVKKRKADYVAAVPGKQTDDELLQECLNKIQQAKRKATVRTWVSRFAGIKNLKHHVARKLCQRGILRADEKTILLIFKQKIYPEINPRPEQEIISRLHDAVLDNADEINPRTIVLLSIAKSVNLLTIFLSRDEQKSHKKRIGQLVNGEITGKATKEAIEALQAAVMVACIMPALMASTTHK